MKRLLLKAMMLCTAATVANAQTDEIKKFEAFNHLDLTLTAGTTGVGFDLGTPIGDKFQVRTGFSFMPHINKVLHFGVQVGSRQPDQTEKEFNEISQSRFDRLAELLERFTGYRADNQIDMRTTPTYYNFHLLADFYPLANNKHWRVTAGFYLGNRQIGRSINTTEDMPSLLAVGIYNNLYSNSTLMNMLKEYSSEFKDYGLMSIHIADYLWDSYAEYYDEDVYETKTVTAEAGIFVGEGADAVYYPYGSEYQELTHRKGDLKEYRDNAYRMVPDDDSMVKAWAYVNRFKPYLGIGYDGRLLKNDDRWHIGFDAGVMFWGGAPNVVTHDGTSLTKDVKNVRGRVGDYVDIIKKFEVFPVVNLRITRRLF